MIPEGRSKSRKTDVLKSLLAASAALLLVSTAQAADTITTIKSERLAEIVTALTGQKATITKPEAGVEIVTISDDGDVDFILTDLTGRTLRSFNNLYGESLIIERENLPEGTYLFTLRCSRGIVSGKLLIR